jgi:hypothetical protein
MSSRNKILTLYSTNSRIVLQLHTQKLYQQAKIFSTESEKQQWYKLPEQNRQIFHNLFMAGGAGKMVQFAGDRRYFL